VERRKRVFFLWSAAFATHLLKLKALCVLLSRQQRKVAPPSRVVCFGREAYIPKVYELVELNTKRACARAASKKTTACTWEKATRLRVRKINGTLMRKYIILNAGDALRMYQN